MSLLFTVPKDGSGDCDASSQMIIIDCASSSSSVCEVCWCCCKLQTSHQRPYYAWLHRSCLFTDACIKLSKKGCTNAAALVSNCIGFFASATRPDAPVVTTLNCHLRFWPLMISLHYYTCVADISIRSKVIRGSQNSEIRSRDPGHAHFGVALWSGRSRSPSCMSVPNL